MAKQPNRRYARQLNRTARRSQRLGNKFLKHTKNVKHKVNQALKASNERIDDYLNEHPLSQGLAAGAAPETETQRIALQQNQLGQDWLEFAQGTGS